MILSEEYFGSGLDPNSIGFLNPDSGYKQIKNYSQKGELK
jgi:hypothetical protein